MSEIIVICNNRTTFTTGVKEIQQAIQEKQLVDEPSTYTVNWYKKLITEESVSLELECA